MGRWDQRRIAPSPTHRRASVVLTSVALIAVSVAGCGSSRGASSNGPSAAAGLASLKVISTDVTVQGGADASASPGSTGQELAVGDTVSTDPVGFAEVGFFDGSLTRVDHAARFTLVDLQEPEASQVVHTQLSAGRSWNRVDRLSESQTWQIDTPVASATVRGTAFSVDCAIDVPDACRFAVVDGSVELGLPDGSAVTLDAGQEATVVKDEPPPAPTTVGVDVLLADAWIDRNITLDTDGGKPLLETAAAAPDDGQYVLTASRCDSTGDLAGGLLTIADSTVVLVARGGDPLVMKKQPSEYGGLSELQLVLPPDVLPHREFIDFAFISTGGGVVLEDHATAGSDPCRTYIGHRISADTATPEAPPAPEHCGELDQQVSALVAVHDAVNGSVYDCQGGWAVGSSQTREGEEGTEVFRWNGTAWEDTDRSSVCEHGEVPPELYLAGCFTN